MKTNLKKIGLALAMLSLFGLIGMIGAQSPVTVTALYTSTYVQGTCVLDVANAGVPGQQATTINLTSGGSLYVENSGVSDSVTGATSMPVYVAYQDDGGASALPSEWAENAPSAGWYQGNTWITGISTSWQSNEYGTNWYPLEGLVYPTFGGLPAEGPAYSALLSVGNTQSGYVPITFSVAAPATLPAGTYNQQIVITGSC